MSQQIEIIMTAIEQTLPPVFSRDEVAHHLSGILSKKTLANLDCLGIGVPVRTIIGKKVVYERESFMKWLHEYCR